MFAFNYKLKQPPRQLHPPRQNKKKNRGWSGLRLHALHLIKYTLLCALESAATFSSFRFDQKSARPFFGAHIMAYAHVRRVLCRLIAGNVSRTPQTRIFCLRTLVICAHLFIFFCRRSQSTTGSFAIILYAAVTYPGFRIGEMDGERS